MVEEWEEVVMAVVEGWAVDWAAAGWVVAD